MPELPQTIEITEDELVKLIAVADREHPLPLVFGPRRAAIERGKPGSYRALAALAAMRGIN